MNKLQLVLAGFCALTGSVLIHVYLNRLEHEITGGKKLSVLVVTRDIPVGAVLEKEALATKEVPAAYVTTRQIQAEDTEQIIGTRVTAGLKVDDSLEWTDLTEATSPQRDLSGLVQEGMRAVSIKTDNLFDGLLRPGDRVDVLFSAQQSSEVIGTSTLLQNVLVLSVGGHTSREDESHNNYQGPSSVVLSVTPLQSQILSHAAERGRLDLTLRNPNDTSLVGNLTTTQGRDVLGSRDINPTVPARPRSIDNTKDIEHVH